MQRLRSAEARPRAVPILCTEHQALVWYKLPDQSLSRGAKTPTTRGDQRAAQGERQGAYEQADDEGQDRAAEEVEAEGGLDLFGHSDGVTGKGIRSASQQSSMC